MTSIYLLVFVRLFIRRITPKVAGRFGWIFQGTLDLTQLRGVCLDQHVDQSATRMKDFLALPDRQWLRRTEYGGATWRMRWKNWQHF